MMRMSLSLLLFVLLAPACGGAQSPFIKAPVRVDPCVNDLFFVDVPLEVDIERVPRDFTDTLARALTEKARQNVGWFCEGGVCDPLRRPGSLVAVVAPLLPDDREAERRFLRAAFYYTPKAGSFVDAQRLMVRDAAVCDAVAGIEAAVAEHGGPVADKLYVGRACMASGQQIRRDVVQPRPKLRDDFDRDRLKPAISDAMLNWHLERMGVDEPRRSRTPIVLIDTGVRGEIVATEAWPTPAEVLPSGYDADARPVTPPARVAHPHGTEMAVAIRQITTAPIVDVPVLGINGRVPLGQVARAVDSAARRLGDRPGVINLSLGWAPEIERVRKLARGACITLEAPAGEAMRSVLARVRAAHPKVLVVAAGGNRARLGDGYLDQTIARYEATVTDDALASDAFYPAQWGLRSTDGAPTVLAVGATQSTGRVAGMDQGQATLFAPGQHVYLNAEGDAVRDICAAGQTALTFPRAVTGSSIAAAFTSAAAAGIWDQQPDVTAAEAARLLYLAGEPMGVTRDGRVRPYAGINRIAGRRLHLGRLDILLSAHERTLRACGEGGAAFTGPTVSGACAQALEALRFDERLRAESAAIVWPRTRAPACPVAFGDASRLRMRVDGAQVCGGDVAEPLCANADLYSAGDAGPQPELDGCDDCMLFELSDGTARMQGIINPGFPEGTLITDPWLIAYWEDGSKATVDLSGTDQVWAAGKSLDISGLKLDLGDHLLSKANVFLSTTIKTPSQTTGTTDMSPVRVGDE